MPKRVGVNLTLVLDLAGSMRLNAADLKDAAQELENRPVWTEWIGQVLKDAEELLSNALDDIHEAQQRLDCMPAQKEAAE